MRSRSLKLKARSSKRWLAPLSIFVVGMLVGAWLRGGPEVAPEPDAAPAAFLSHLLAAAPDQAPAAPAAAAVGATGVHSVSVAISGTIPGSLAAAVGPLSPALSAEVSRLLVWDLDLRRDLRSGDQLDVVYEGDSAETIEILALRLRSSKQGRDIEAFRFKATGDGYPSWWFPNGTEVPRRLLDSPLADYEQITSLLKDRPRHKGMDFKTVVGTPVVSPRSAKVARTNWNLTANGNCVELHFQDGVVAKFLHLSRTDVSSGDNVSAGAIIGLSGNTGHSTGPHLHYQLNRGKAVVDPLDYHGTERRQLPVEDRPALDRTVEELAPLLDAPPPAV